MGLSFRKSVKFGPVRLNFSKSGVGFSTGVKGLRYSAGPRGAFINVGANGIYYRKQISRKQRVEKNYSQEPEKTESTFTAHDVEDILTATVSELVDSSSSDLIQQINLNLKKPAKGPLVRWSMVVCACMFSLVPVVGFSALLFLIVGLVYASKIDAQDTAAKSTALFYEMEDDIAVKFQKLQQACHELTQCDRVWRVKSTQDITDWKHNAGAGQTISRLRATVTMDDLPPYILSNLKIPCIRLDIFSLYFLPDQMLVYQNGSFGEVKYNTLSVVQSVSQFIESGYLPRDSQRVGTTWQYPNKSGGPDLRFKDNPEIPVMQYGYLDISSPSGFHIVLQISNTHATTAFDEAVKLFQSEKSARQPRGEKSNQKKAKSRKTHEQSTQSEPIANPQMHSAQQVLGVSSTATADQIKDAYHRMVQMYHPDKVAGLAPEFTEIAENRMKEINAAYHELMK